MRSPQRITSVRFHRYKAFRDFSIALDRFNILVGPNNAGKSTIIGAFRILAEAIRKAKAKSPDIVEGPHGETRGYAINLGHIPVATENIFHNYEDDQPASVSFRMSTGDSLLLFFPKRGVCNLICETSGRPITSPISFRQRFFPEIGFVPILGPVEHEEPVYQKEAAREALLSHRASRNFRNIWYHYPEPFDEFRALIQTTWPGMDIKRPEIDSSHVKPLLLMFCPEDRIDREIYWSGFGFQVWCQMLTFLITNKSSSLFIIDEPDIYLHSDLQRQLVTTLRSLGPDILIATHSTEIISEADPNEILVITKKVRSAKRVSDPAQLRSIFDTLGSNLNPFLTQVARTKRLVFVEGKDFQILARFASKLNIRAVAMRSDFAVVPTQGFNPTRAKIFREGVEATLDSKIAVALLFDRDYRSDSELAEELTELQAFCEYAHIHSKKELENFLLVPDALNRAITQRIAERNSRIGGEAIFSDDIKALLSEITNTMRHDVAAQFLKRQHQVVKSLNRELDDATVTSQLLAVFDKKWGQLDSRLDMVSGKLVLARLNAHLQDKLSVTITPALIIDSMQISEIATEMKDIISALQGFATGKSASSQHF
jgi:energy-coupling factor transporter ATP-binding protein EcfA2